MKAEELRQLFRTGHRCVRIASCEEHEARALALEAVGGWGLKAWTWSVTQGLRDNELEGGSSIPDTENPGAALWYLTAHAEPDSIIILHDLADHFSDARVLRAWRDLRERMEMKLHDRVLLVMIDHGESVPLLVATCSTPLRIELPDDAEVEAILRRTISRLRREQPIKATVSADTFQAMLQHLRGLSRRQVEQVITEAVITDGELSEKDIPLIIAAKRRVFTAAGILEFVDAPTSMDQIGGLNRLKHWLAHREDSFSDRAAAYGLSPPRGVLLLGVQGAGKSLAAKAIATAWSRPLMRLDPGALYDRYIGESERRLRDALRQGEAMAPMVLWIDEIEKGFASAASQSTDGGLSRRMFGTLLTWMQEHKAPVFLVATANDIEALPPELLRKGRFDEIFFVDLPSAEARTQIIKVHLTKRKQDPGVFDLPLLTAATDGFSGAEIEQAVLAGLHSAFAERVRLDTGRLAAEIKITRPLSVTMAERVAALREWARTRCVAAD